MEIYKNGGDSSSSSSSGGGVDEGWLWIVLVWVSGGIWDGMRWEKERRVKVDMGVAQLWPEKAQHSRWGGTAIIKEWPQCPQASCVCRSGNME